MIKLSIFMSISANYIVISHGFFDQKSSFAGHCALITLIFYCSLADYAAF